MFRVLGTLGADRDGSALSLPSRRQRAVLAALLTRAGRPVSADELVEAAWGERLPDHPKAALQTVLSRLRTALGAELISASISGYRLDVTADDVDALRFEALRERAAHAPDAAAAGLLEAALALWCGPAYAEFADRDFASAEAARLNELRAATVEDYADLSLRSGRATDAIAHLEALQASEPWRDRCVGLLMRALCGSGRATEALQVYDRHRRGLAAEFGLDPSPALQDLQARILRNELPEAPRPAPQPPRWFAVFDAVRRPRHRDGGPGRRATRQSAGHGHRYRRGRQDTAGRRITGRTRRSSQDACRGGRTGRRAGRQRRRRRRRRPRRGCP